MARINNYGATLLFATGSAKHLKDLAEVAQQKWLRLAPDGIWHRGQIIPCREEVDVYTHKGLPFIEPELREGRGEVGLAPAGVLPRLVTHRDIKGLLHCHTNSSDGLEALSQMAEATRARGYSYFGVADHSRSARFAGGLSIKRSRPSTRQRMRSTQATAIAFAY